MEAGEEQPSSLCVCDVPCLEASVFTPNLTDEELLQAIKDKAEEDEDDWMPGKNCEQIGDEEPFLLKINNQQD